MEDSNNDFRSRNGFERGRRKKKKKEAFDLINEKQARSQETEEPSK